MPMNWRPSPQPMPICIRAMTTSWPPSPATSPASSTRPCGEHHDPRRNIAGQSQLQPTAGQGAQTPARRPHAPARIERLQRSTRLDQLVVATRTGRGRGHHGPCAELGVPVSRPAGRRAAASWPPPFGPSQIVRGSPGIVRSRIRPHRRAGRAASDRRLRLQQRCWDPSYGWTGRDPRRRHPGSAGRERAHATQREHVTYYIRQHEAQFKMSKLAPASTTHALDGRARRLRPGPSKSISGSTRPNPAFATTDDILALLAREPQLATPEHPTSTQ